MDSDVINLPAGMFPRQINYGRRHHPELGSGELARLPGGTFVFFHSRTDRPLPVCLDRDVADKLIRAPGRRRRRR